MSRILKGINILKVIVFLIILYAIWQLISIFKNKKHQVLEKRSLKILLQIITPIIILILLLFSLNLDYMFMESVFPKMYQWLRLSLFFLSMTMILKYVVMNSNILNNK